MMEPSTATRFLPFERTSDIYGKLGKAQLSTKETARLLLLGCTLLPVKAILCVLCLLIIASSECIFRNLLPSSYKDTRQAAFRFGNRLLLYCLGFWRISYRDLSRPDDVQPAALVSNHMSYADIMIACSFFNPGFAAKSSVKHLPLIGYVADCIGCLYIKRENKKKDAIPMGPQLKARMQEWREGDNPLCFFPEGTTTNGRYLLPFKTGAFLAGVPVQPMLIRYDDGHVSPSWETIGGLRHLLLILANPAHSAHLVKLPVYKPSEAEVEDPRLYADNVRAYMAEHATWLTLSDSSLNEKREYQELLKNGGSVMVDSHLNGVTPQRE